MRIDSGALRIYSVFMGRRRFSKLIVIGIAVLLTTLITPAQADTAVLMVLAHTENGRLVRVGVPAARGAFLSPSRGKEFDRWAVQPGNALVGGKQPDDVLVELYRGAESQRILVCAIGIRYFRDARGAWVPHYQLNQEPLVARDADGRWQPLPGVPLIMLTGSTLPNAEGFYPALEFGLTAGLLEIDSWVVR